MSTLYDNLSERKELEMSRIRTLPAGVICAVGLSLAAAVAGAPVAAAAPGGPVAGPVHPAGPAGAPMRPGGLAGAPMRPEPPPTHPIYHHTDDLTHPVWSVTHPVSALAP